MRIGVITSKDPSTNRRVWSGSVYNSCRAIENRGHEIKYIAVKKDIFVYSYYLLYKMWAFLFGKKSNPLYSVFISKRYARSLKSQDIKDVDLLFVPAMTPYIAYYDVKIPIVFFTDSTFQLYSDYYPQMTNLLKKNKEEGLLLDSMVYNKSSVIICSSDWAKQSLMVDFRVDEKKIFVLEFGPNVDRKDIIVNDKTLEVTDKGIDVLFMGVDWNRKGGDVAVETCEELNKMGIQARLHIIGCRLPKKYVQKDFIKSYGFLNKNNPNEYCKILSLILQSDLFLLPTRAEAAGVVFAEASAYSLPIFTYNTGGVGNYVIDGVNGYKLPISCSGKDFASKISDCINSGEWNTLKKGCQSCYNSNLNWDIWGCKFDQVLKEL